MPSLRFSTFDMSPIFGTMRKYAVNTTVNSSISAIVEKAARFLKKDDSHISGRDSRVASASGRKGATAIISIVSG